jgi:hypothetical protein
MECQMGLKKHTENLVRLELWLMMTVMLWDMSRLLWDTCMLCPADTNLT